MVAQWLSQAAALVQPRIDTQLPSEGTQRWELGSDIPTLSRKHGFEWWIIIQFFTSIMR